VAQLYKASKLAFSDLNRNRKLGLNPWSPYARVAKGLLKTSRNKLKKQAQMTQN